ncbi:LysR substrate-binding domain-containing protein [Microvirga sp. W0021]|uniref:LysR substrate-binding domain-containing protein n=1 Tax=Hohaiivirga grylli TaxID=3133970 RepID=A0ABV0BFS9_9HYPH
MQKLPKLRQLKAFQEIIRCGSIRSAAKSLGQSQPALTRTLRELEATLGTALVTRGAHGISLTESGKAFAVRMHFILEELKRAQEELSHLNAHSQGKVAFGFSSLIAFTVLPGVIRDFRMRRPLAGISFKEAQLSNLIPALREGQLDFAIGSLNEDIPLSEFIEEPLFTAPFSIIASKDHPLANCTSIDELRHAAWFLPETSMGYYKELENYLWPIEGSILHSDSISSILSLVTKIDVLSAIATAMLHPLGLGDTIVALPIKPELPSATYSLIYPRKAPLTETARLMIDTIRRHCRKHNWNKP